MCFSTELWSDYRLYVREFGADIDIKEFVRLYARRAGGRPIRTPKAMDNAMAGSSLPEAASIAEAIERYKKMKAHELERKLFEQRERLADAERSLAKKLTKTAMEERRKANNNVKDLSRQIADLDRAQLSADDARIFPGWWAPVMVARDTQRVIVPMRYRCRLPGWTAALEKKYDGTYNARLDKMDSSWRKLFGHHHGVVAVRRFFENVARHDMEHRALRPGEKKENVRLEFQPDTGADMYVACLWSLAKDDDGEDLWSYAIITDDPPPEIAATGHDRCPIQIKSENIEAWLHPERTDLDAMYDILQDRPRPYYDHRILKAA